ncbi:putative uncharacterized protein [Odoribacter laneus CAG:561]|nr:putative uncharacterized protein [Odoribacter laneus CAG:561]
MSKSILDIFFVKKSADPCVYYEKFVDLRYDRNYGKLWKN